ncbi:MAG: hypothetical protein WAV41_02705 [Microgenomates group bacterium]
MNIKDQKELLGKFSAGRLGMLLPEYQARRATLFALKDLTVREVARGEGVSVGKVRKSLDRAVHYMEIVEANS